MQHLEHQEAVVSVQRSKHCARKEAFLQQAEMPSVQVHLAHAPSEPVILLALAQPVSRLLVCAYAALQLIAQFLLQVRQRLFLPVLFLEDDGAQT